MTLKYLKHEVALGLGVAAAAAEAGVATTPSGQLHDVLAAGIPFLAALGIRPNVVPVAKIVGRFKSIIPVVDRLEATAQVLDNMTPKPKPAPLSPESIQLIADVKAAVEAATLALQKIDHPAAASAVVDAIQSDGLPLITNQ